MESMIRRRHEWRKHKRLLVFAVSALFACKIMDTGQGPFRIDSLESEHSIVAAGEGTEIKIRAQSLGSSTMPDSALFSTSRGYFIDSNDSTKLGARVSVVVDSLGGAKACLFNPFIVEEETSWVEIALQDQTAKLPVVFIPSAGSGDAVCALSFVKAEPKQIGVRGFGFQEISRLTFAVTGARGLPVDDGIWVEFAKSGPGGTPADTLLISAASTRDGQVTTALRSGSRSGTVLLKATVRGSSSQSQAIPLVIHGGLPRRGNQSIYSGEANIPGAAVTGSTVQITVLYFDVSHNPAAEGTAVYFRSNTGGITASGFLDATGKATATFTSGSQVPSSQRAWVWAETSDDSGNALLDSCSILLSGATRIGIFAMDSSALGDTVTISNGGLASLLVVVCDSAGNPLAQGTNIQITASAGAIVGTSAITLGDTVDKANTRFAIQWTDDSPQSQTRTGYLSVSVTSRNGDRQAGVWGVLD